MSGPITMYESEARSHLVGDSHPVQYSRTENGADGPIMSGAAQIGPSPF